jgi:hypothetical protein
MSTSAVHATTTQTHSQLRLLGIIAMACAPLMAVSMLLKHWKHIENPSTDATLNVIGLIYLVGFAASASGMFKLRVTGGPVRAGVLLAIQMIGLAMAASQDIMDLVRVGQGTQFYGLADASWPLSHTFMLVIGGFVYVTGRWKGWKAFAPLLCGLALPLAIVAKPVGGQAALDAVFGILTFAGFYLLGRAVFESAYGCDPVKA